MMLGLPFQLFVAPILTFFIAYLTIFWLIRFGNSLNIIDIPNDRSLHAKPIPRTGGLGLIGAIFITGLLFVDIFSVPVFIGLAFVSAISFVDDIKPLPVWLRLSIHTIAAMLLVVNLFFDTHSWLFVITVGLGIIWITNLYNFMDGSDGLAGGMTAIGFGYYGVAATLAGDIDFATINFSVAASALAFLRFNFYPAKIFMGDVGAISLGFLAGALGLLGWKNNLWSLWLPLLIFSPFIADATVTFIKRLLRGKKIWQAHNEHYYQRLIKGGLGHRNTALLAYILMLVVGGTAILSTKFEFAQQSWISSMWGIAYLVIMHAFDRHQSHHNR